MNYTVINVYNNNIYMQTHYITVSYIYNILSSYFSK